MTENPAEKDARYAAGTGVDVIDTHCHVSPFWYEPVDVFVHQMDRSGVTQATLVQLTGQYDNDYLMNCVKDYPGRFVAVVLVDHLRDDACEQLEGLVAQGAAGTRLNAGARSPGKDPLAIWKTANRLGIPVTIHGSISERLNPQFADLIAALPNLPIVLEHLGCHGYRPNGRTGALDESEMQRYEQIMALSRFPNVYMKAHGVGEIASRPRSVGSELTFTEPIPPCHMMAYEAFGANRLMWGSNFPIVSSLEGYTNALASCRNQYSGLSPTGIADIFSGTARRLYFAS